MEYSQQGYRVNMASLIIDVFNKKLIVTHFFLLCVTSARAISKDRVSLVALNSFGQPSVMQPYSMFLLRQTLAMETGE